MKKYVAIPSKNGVELTKGKEYLVIKLEENKSRIYGRGFVIFNDVGHELYCCEFKCEHLNGKDWTIKEVE